MDSHFKIRLARQDDVPMLADVERAAGTLFDQVGYGHLAACLCDPALLREAIEHRRLWVAVEGRDLPIGFAVAEWIDEMPYLHELDVHPAYGRRGIGLQLLETACDWALAQVPATLTLSTFRSVPWNAPFYARHGFVEVDSSTLSPGFVMLRNAETKRMSIDDRVIMRRSF